MKEQIRTAKDLAWKAYLDMYMTFTEGAEVDSIRERFEHWWSIHYWNNDPLKDHFKPRHTVMIDQKVYIQAE